MSETMEVFGTDGGGGGGTYFAFQRGYGDEMAGKSWFANPYSEDSTLFRRWVDGKAQAIKDKRKEAA